MTGVLYTQGLPFIRASQSVWTQMRNTLPSSPPRLSVAHPAVGVISRITNIAITAGAQSIYTFPLELSLITFALFVGLAACERVSHGTERRDGWDGVLTVEIEEVSRRTRKEE